jgi:hypothetical protein
MAYTSRPWINRSAVKRLSDLQQRYSAMASPGVIEQAAQAAGGTMANSMRVMMRSQPDLSGYTDVAKGLTSWKGYQGIFVGLPPGHELVDRANEMEQKFPLKQVTADMERQTGETQRSFYDALADLVGLGPGIGPVSPRQVT